MARPGGHRRTRASWCALRARGARPGRAASDTADTGLVVRAVGSWRASGRAPSDTGLVVSAGARGTRPGRAASDTADTGLVVRAAGSWRASRLGTSDTGLVVSAGARGASRPGSVGRGARGERWGSR
ncbi:hypothetical protein [Hyalangium versicolor]|uniref:hypothetical protein n=1 Tax=Hyalangium versicolor TaxID=2861190 RepID=UPI001CCB0A93|nr:hypothetical protein [Hyalangium versicolor]